MSLTNHFSILKIHDFFSACFRIISRAKKERDSYIAFNMFTVQLIKRCMNAYINALFSIQHEKSSIAVVSRLIEL